METPREILGTRLILYLALASSLSYVVYKFYVVTSVGL